jgi:hypothetical protein
LRIEYAGKEDLMGIIGSWDGFKKLLPMGHDARSGKHALSIILPEGKVSFRFVFPTGKDGVSNLTPYAIETLENGLASHVMDVK